MSPVLPAAPKTDPSSEPKSPPPPRAGIPPPPPREAFASRMACRMAASNEPYVCAWLRSMAWMNEYVMAPVETVPLNACACREERTGHFLQTRKRVEKRKTALLADCQTRLDESHRNAVSLKMTMLTINPSAVDLLAKVRVGRQPARLRIVSQPRHQEAGATIQNVSIVSQKTGKRARCKSRSTVLCHLQRASFVPSPRARGLRNRARAWETEVGTSLFSRGYCPPLLPSSSPHVSQPSNKTGNPRRMLRPFTIDLTVSVYPALNEEPMMAPCAGQREDRPSRSNSRWRAVPSTMGILPVFDAYGWHLFAAAELTAVSAEVCASSQPLKLMASPPAVPL